jgi:hypothetical protein
VLFRRLKLANDCILTTFGGLFEGVGNGMGLVPQALYFPLPWTTGMEKGGHTLMP